MNNQKQTLQQILEALMSINTKGNDTITMANILQALSNVINTMPVVNEENIEPEE